MKKILFSLIGVLLTLFMSNASIIIKNDTTDKFVESKYLNEGFDNGVSVTLYLNYEVNDISNIKIENRKEKQTYIRKSNYEYYYNKNLDYIDTFNIKYDDIEISAYSPFITIYYNSYENYEIRREYYVNLSKDNNIKCIIVEKRHTFLDELSTNTINDNASSLLINLNEIKGLIGIDDETYLGDNVKVGIIDSGIPDNMQQHSNYYNLNFEDAIVASHTTNIATIFSLIAPNASLYFCDRYLFENSIVELFDNQVDIITMSYGSDVTGNYTALDLKIDFISRYNDCIFICSGGNNANSRLYSRYVTSPGIAVNAVTVGCVDKINRISFFSSYGVNPDIEDIIKPDIVAPAENIVISDILTISGTSFSVPMVAGVLAKLMDEFDNIYNIEIFVSALLNGADKLAGQTELISEYCGSGVINYSNSRDILYNQYYYSFNVNDSVTSNALVYEGTYILGCYTKFNFYLYHMYNASDCSLSDSLNIQVNYLITKYKVEFYNGDTLVDEVYLNSNIGSLYFENSTGSDIVYTIKIYLVGNKVESGTEKIVFTFSREHEHIYTTYTRYNNSLHYKYCNCGYVKTDAHTVANSTAVFRRCIYCGQFVDTSNTYVRYE